MIAKESVDVRRVGTALIGGDFTGNARGANAIDIQPTRSVSTQVGSGNNSVALGQNVTVSGLYAIATGYGSTASGVYSTAVGNMATASGYYSLAAGFSVSASSYNTTALGSYAIASDTNASAVGTGAVASAASATALGSAAKARIAKTVSLSGPVIQRKDAGEGSGAAFESFAGVEVTLMSQQVDLKVVGDKTITLPSGCRFWIDELGLVATSISGLTTQPTVRFGITGHLAKHLAAAMTTDLTAAGKREIHDPLVPEDGETSLTAGVSVAAVGTTVLGRFYWKGMLVEDE